jgi:hypothetical protein
MLIMSVQRCASQQRLDPDVELPAALPWAAVLVCWMRMGEPMTSDVLHVLLLFCRQWLPCTAVAHAWLDSRSCSRAIRNNLASVPSGIFNNLCSLVLVYVLSTGEHCGWMTVAAGALDPTS